MEYNHFCRSFAFSLDKDRANKFAAAFLQECIDIIPHFTSMTLVEDQVGRDDAASVCLSRLFACLN